MNAPRHFYRFAFLGSLSLVSAGAAIAQFAQPARTSTIPRPAPAWDNSSWLNVDSPVRLDQLRGRVVLLNFWVFTC